MVGGDIQVMTVLLDPLVPIVGQRQPGPHCVRGFGSSGSGVPISVMVGTGFRTSS